MAEDCRSKLAHKLLEMCAGVAAEYATQPTNPKADAEFWRIWNAANGASARLGLPHHETPAVCRPSDFAVDEFLAEVIREGEERGGELTL